VLEQHAKQVKSAEVDLSDQHEESQKAVKQHVNPKNAPNHEPTEPIGDQPSLINPTVELPIQTNPRQLPPKVWEREVARPDKTE